MPVPSSPSPARTALGAPALAGPDRRWLVGFDTAALPTHTTGVLVIGSGIAGLTAALHCARDREVTLVTKGELTETNTWYAQGGIAGAVGEADSVELHVADTLVVGQGLCDEAVVRAVVEEAPEALASLQGFGVRFDLAEGGGVALAREGGHSLPRVLHSGDKTGAAIQAALTRTVLSRGRIPAIAHRFLVDLLTDGERCVGALLLDTATGRLETHFADAVVLATGGAGQAYRITTNPLVATGDGVAAAWRAGATVSDLEFVQFHPTALDHDSAPRFLVSEALRGEGAYLRDCDGERFMVGVHPLAELAPRDVVSRQIEQVMARCGRDNVWLDARHLGGSYLRSRFPTIWSACAEAGYDLSEDLVPVAPAAHYLVGGVRVDVDGRTSVPGLFASGEVAATGLHGANRLASNSLLEGLVFSRRIARALDADAPVASRTRPRIVGDGPGLLAAEAAPRASEVLPALQAAMSRNAGMSRTSESLAIAAAAAADATRALAGPLAPADLGAADLATVAELIVAAATAREESRGCHYRADHGERDDARWRGHTLWRCGEPARFVPLCPSNGL